MKILSTNIIFASKYFKVNQKRIERHGKTFTKDFIERNPTVLILPYTANDIYIESQYRDAFGHTSLEVVGGTIEEGDDPLVTAQRELREETGLVAKTWKKLYEWNLSANMLAKIYIFAATDLVEGEQHLDSDEEITLLKLPVVEVIKKIEDGEITVTSHIAALLLFDRLQKGGKL